MPLAPTLPLTRRCRLKSRLAYIGCVPLSCYRRRRLGEVPDNLARIISRSGCSLAYLREAPGCISVRRNDSAVFAQKFCQWYKWTSPYSGDKHRRGCGACAKSRSLCLIVNPVGSDAAGYTASLNFGIALLAILPTTPTAKPIASKPTPVKATLNPAVSTSKPVSFTSAPNAQRVNKFHLLSSPSCYQQKGRKGHVVHWTS